LIPPGNLRSCSLEIKALGTVFLYPYNWPISAAKFTLFWGDIHKHKGNWKAEIKRVSTKFLNVQGMQVHDIAPRLTLIKELEYAVSASSGSAWR
jgi:hypothetical protein